jgi:PPOX class probable F420-dependent enzyme
VSGPATSDAALEAFLAERHLATLTTLRPDGRPHVVPVGFTWDAGAGLVRVITRTGSAKVANARANPLVALCQVDGRRWASLEGTAVVSADPARVAEAVRRYAERYRQPGERPDRVVVEVRVTRLLGSW